LLDISVNVKRSFYTSIICLDPRISHCQSLLDKAACISSLFYCLPLSNISTSRCTSSFSMLQSLRRVTNKCSPSLPVWLPCSQYQSWRSISSSSPYDRHPVAVKLVLSKDRLDNWRLCRGRCTVTCSIWSWSRRSRTTEALQRGKTWMGWMARGRKET